MNHYPGVIRDGNFVFNPGQLTFFKNYCKKLKNGDYEISIRKLFKKRTPNQNRLYWKRWQILTDITGYSSLDLHAIAMQARGFGEQIKVMNIDYFLRMSSTLLTTVAF